MIENTGADGVMIARGAIADPFIFLKILSEKPTGEIRTIKDFAIAHLREEVKASGSERATIEFRKFIGYYFKNVENSKSKRAEIMLSASAELTEELLNKYHNHPLVSNLEILKEEVNEYLLEISKIVNKK